MLQYSLLKNHAGILLHGDYSSLRALHEAVSNANEKSPVIFDKEGWFLSLAYEVRKAYEQQREILKPPEFYPEIGKRYGTKILWPTILLQCLTLRTSLQMFDSSKLDQAMTYLLEYVVTSALMDDFGAAGPGIIDRWQSIPAFHRYPGEKLDSRTAVFCGWSKRQRAVGLADLLFSLDPAYQTLYPIMVRNGCTNLISPEEYETFEDIEWPNPRW